MPQLTLPSRCVGRPRARVLPARLAGIKRRAARVIGQWEHAARLVDRAAPLVLTLTLTLTLTPAPTLTLALALTLTLTLTLTRCGGARQPSGRRAAAGTATWTF